MDIHRDVMGPGHPYVQMGQPTLILGMLLNRHIHSEATVIVVHPVG